MRRKILERVVRLATEGNDGHPYGRGARHFSAVVQGGEILSLGVNRRGPPPLGFGYRRGYVRTVHAEPDAFRRARGLVAREPWDMVNVRLNAAGALRMSAPCECCSAFLLALGCRCVWFSTGSGWASLRLTA